VRPVLTAAAVFVAMEAATYAVHRWVMHGPAIAVHQSHHRARGSRVEANDLFPLVFAALAGGALVAGYHGRGLGWLVPVGLGVTLYGLVYGAVHDGAIHGRLPLLRRLPLRSGPLARLAAAHRLHHLYGGEPYGMLLPVVPAALKERAAVAGRPLRTDSAR
jgi:beta-carotene 3-hydroxylase